LKRLLSILNELKTLIRKQKMNIPSQVDGGF
jgi:hypothetical protein